MSYEQMLSQYLDMLDEKTGYSFSNRELIQHTIEWDHAELQKNLEALQQELGY